MECNRDDALQAKVLAERKFTSNDFAGAKKFALKAQALFPGLEGIGQMITTMDVYIASEPMVAGEKDWYAILSVSSSADDEAIKKQYRKLALQLHPDKNKSIGAEGAFQLISEAWNMLSDKSKRATYDQRRNPSIFQQGTSQTVKTNAASNTVNGFYNFVPRAASKTNHVKHKPTSFPAAARPPQTGPAQYAFASRNVPPVPHVRPSTSAAPHDNAAQNLKPQSSSVPAHHTPPSPPHQPPPCTPMADTFWTLCNRCKTQYEYKRVYLNQNLLCPTCKEPFLASEIPKPLRSNGHGDKGENRSVSSSQCGPNNVNFQWGPFSRTAGAASASASSVAAAQAANMVHQTYEKVRREREEAQAAARERRRFHSLKRGAAASENVSVGLHNETTFKKMRTVDNQDAAASHKVPSGNNPLNASTGADGAFSRNGIEGITYNSRISRHINIIRQFSPWDIRARLVENAKTVVQEKLVKLTCKLSPCGTDEKASKKQKIKEIDGENVQSTADSTNKNQEAHGNAELNSNGNLDFDKDQVTFNVPDPDFYNFDEDRLEESFEGDQIWATYDDEDGMPRYYAYIQKVISVKPFKIKMSFLTSKTNNEFSSLNWVASGFPKSCGELRIGRYETNQTVNMFSHKISWEKGPRGTIRVYPRKGDVWALYRNWSPDWNEHTPDDVIYTYDMVEVLDNYSDQQGISVAPLIKVMGFKTVFQRVVDEEKVKRIPKEEMFRFSHQVPFYRLSGTESKNIPEGCYELDPAATPKELLQVYMESNDELKDAAAYPSSLSR